MNKDDHAVVNKIRSGFQSQERIVKVSDIFPGEWEKICASDDGWQYGDIRDVVSKFSGVSKNNIEFIKNSSTRTYYDDDVWLLYFFYPPNKIEIYHISVNNMSPITSQKLNDWGCVEKDNAFFVKGNYYRVDWDTYSHAINPITDRFVLSIIEMKE